MAGGRRVEKRGTELDKGSKTAVQAGGRLIRNGTLPHSP